MMTLKILAKCFRRIFFDSPRVLRNSTPGGFIEVQSVDTHADADAGRIPLA